MRRMSEGPDDLYAVASHFVPTSIYDNIYEQRKGWGGGGGGGGGGAPPPGRREKKLYGRGKVGKSKGAGRRKGVAAFQAARPPPPPQPKEDESAYSSVRRNGNFVYDYDDYYGVGGVGVGGVATGRVDRSGDAIYVSEHSGGGGEKGADCCELVVDPLTFVSILSAILAGTAFLNVLITMNIGRKRRRRRRRDLDDLSAGGGGDSSFLFDVLNQGRAHKIYVLCM